MIPHFDGNFQIPGNSGRPAEELDTKQNKNNPVHKETAKFKNIVAITDPDALAATGPELFVGNNPFDPISGATGPELDDGNIPYFPVSNKIRKTNTDSNGAATRFDGEQFTATNNRRAATSEDGEQ